MFSPDDLTPTLIALPYVAFTVKSALRTSLRLRLLSIKPGYCNYLPWLCRW